MLSFNSKRCLGQAQVALVGQSDQIIQPSRWVVAATGGSWSFVLAQIP